MLIAIDIGNTTTCVAVLSGSRVREAWYLDTNGNGGELEKKLGPLLARIKRRCPKAARVTVCSVVPSAINLVRRFVQKIFKVNPVIIGEDIKVPMVNLYRRPDQVGQDRLVGAYAAKKLYGVPAIVIDLGTAVTFDVVSAKGEYLGGAIVPGLRLSAESLYKKTALLPKIQIQRPRAVIGKTTEESILSGLFYGYGSLCQGMIELIARQIKRQPKVILTGGHAELMKKYIPAKIYVIDRHLVLKGLNMLH